MKQWTSKERNVIDLIANIVKVNPFGDEREALDKALAKQASTQQDKGRFEALEEALMTVLSDFEKTNKYNLSHYTGTQRQTLSMVLLFDVFMRFKAPYLEFIKRQLQGSETTHLPFAEELLRYAREHGATEKEAKEILEFSYQIRRAYHFIDDSLVGHSPSMKRLRKELWNNVFTYDIWWYYRFYPKLESFSTLLSGETGTGKGAAARAMGLSSFISYDEQTQSFTTPLREQFVSINLSAFPEGLIESELFGHQKGAFTGALRTHEGLLSRGRPHGSMFLDELGDISLQLQVKLLQVVQERVYSPVGSHEKKQLRGRFIAATHRDIQQLLKKGLFREDFYYRLCSNEIHLPSLRQRIQEAPQELERLVTLLVERIVGASQTGLEEQILTTFSQELGDNYPWPGNVRELEQRIRRVILSGTSVGGGKRHEQTARLEQSPTAKELLQSYCQQLYGQYGNYNEVARIVELDRRTVKKYITGKD